MAGNRGGVWRHHSVRRITVSRQRRVGNWLSLRVGKRSSAPGRARMSAAGLRGWFGDVADGRPSCSVLTQALAVWQWWNYCFSHIPANKKALRVNMDETGVCLFQGHGRGNIFFQRGSGNSTCHARQAEDLLNSRSLLVRRRDDSASLTSVHHRQRVHNPSEAARIATFQLPFKFHRA